MSTKLRGRKSKTPVPSLSNNSTHILELTFSGLTEFNFRHLILRFAELGEPVTGDELELFCLMFNVYTTNHGKDNRNVLELLLEEVWK